jgi:TonB family protein
LLLAGSACGAAQAPAEKSAAVDALVKKLVGPISKSKMKSIVVVGFSGPGKTVTDLGTMLRDEVSDALARQVSDVKVIDRAALDAMLKQNRVSEGMVFNASMGDWIAMHIHADGYVTVHFEVPESGPSPVTMEIFKCGAQSCSRMGIPIVTQMTLSTKEFLASGRDFKQTLNPAAVEPGQNGVTRPKCISCPDPEYTEDARKLKISGTLMMVVTVEADGTTADIFIERPLGHGLDGSAIDEILKWKFDPAVDANGHPVATHVQLEVSFNLR